MNPITIKIRYSGPEKTLQITRNCTIGDLKVDIQNTHSIPLSGKIMVLDETSNLGLDDSLHLSIYNIVNNSILYIKDVPKLTPLQNVKIILSRTICNSVNGKIPIETINKIIQEIQCFLNTGFNEHVKNVLAEISCTSINNKIPPETVTVIGKEIKPFLNLEVANILIEPSQAPSRQTNNSNTQSDDAKTQTENFGAQLEEAQAKIKDLSAQLEEAKKFKEENEKATKTIETLKNELSDTNSKMESLIQKNKDLIKKADTYDSESKELKNEIDGNKEIIQQLSENYNELQQSFELYLQSLNTNS